LDALGKSLEELETLLGGKTNLKSSEKKIKDEDHNGDKDQGQG